MKSSQCKLTSVLRHALITASAMLCAGVQAWAGVTSNLDTVGATSWPGTPVISTMANPNATTATAEVLEAATVLSQTFKIPAGSDYTLQSISLYLGSNGDPTDVILNLFDLGTVAAPGPNGAKIGHE